MFAKSRSEKKTIEQVNQEDLFSNLREIGNILPKILDSRPNVVPIQVTNKPILDMVKQENDDQIKVKTIIPENIVKLTRAQQQVSFDVASLNRAAEKEELRIETVTGEEEEAEQIEEGEIAGLGFEEEDYD